MAKRIFVPTESYRDWQRLLAKPELHWKAGYSAMTLARSWDEQEDQGFPPEVGDALAAAQASQLENLSLLLALPEYQVALPGGDRPSQTDVLAIARGDAGLVVVAVEGKVDEPFGPTVGERRADRTRGVDERLRFLTDCLGLREPIPGSIRYQLLHRSASAVLVAEQFRAVAAVMLVHSFSPTNKWFEDFLEFAALFRVRPDPGGIVAVGQRRGIPLFLGWCRGEQRFREKGADA